MEERTKRGVYLDLAKSPITVTSPKGVVYRFSSTTKANKFKNDVSKKLVQIQSYRNKMVALVNGSPVDYIDFHWNKMVEDVYRTCYARQLYK